MGNGCNGEQSVSTGYDLKYFEAKYGKQQMLDIVKWNVRKEQILQKMPEISQRYRKIIHTFKIDSIRQLNILESSLFDEMESKIKHIEKNDTGEVTKAENKYEMCAEDLMGRKEIQKDCAQLRKKIHQVYESEQKNTKETIQSNFQKYVQNLGRQKRQKFKQIDQLSQQNRQCIRKQTKKEFKKEIKSYKNEIHKEIQEGKICDMVHIKQDHNHLHPKEEIQNIKEKAQKLIRDGQQKILGMNIFGMNSKEILSSPALSPGFWGCCGRA